MPCNSDYLRATNLEINASRIQCLLEELDGKGAPQPNDWRGYHPAIYGKAVDLDALTEKLCARLQETNVSEYSLEMQIWWRDHLAADTVRIEQQVAKATTEAARAAALAKLTLYERRLLGF